MILLRQKKSQTLSKALAWIVILQTAIGSASVLATNSDNQNNPEKRDAALPQQLSPQSEAEALKDLENLDEIILGTSNRVRNRLDFFGLYDLEPALNTPALPNLDYRNLTIRLEDGTLYFSRHHNLSDKNQSIQFSKTQKFQILDRGQLLFSSRMNVQSVAFFDRYLIFVEPELYEDGTPDGTETPDTNARGVQYISFIDLKTYEPLLKGDKKTGPNASIERETPPIFMAPVAVTGPISTLASQKTDTGENILVLKSEAGSTRVPIELFENLSEAHQLAMDVTANLLSAETFESAGPVVEESYSYFHKASQLAAMDAPEQVARAQKFAHQMHESLQKKALAKPNLDQAKKNLDSYNAALLTSPAFAQTLKQTNRSVEAQRKTLARLGLLWKRLSVPRPTTAPKTIREALAMVAVGIRNPHDKKTEFQEGILQLWHNRYAKYAKWGINIASAAALASLYPTQFSHYTYEVLDFGRTVIGMALGKTRGVGHLLWNATSATFSGFRPHVFYETYLRDGRAPKFFVGVTGIISTGLATLGIPIFSMNAWLAARDISNMGLPKYSTYRNNGLSRFGAGIEYLRDRTKGFIERQKNQLEEYLKSQRLSFKRMAERHGQAGDNDTFSKEDDERIKKLIGDLENRNQLWITKMLLKIKTWKIFSHETKPRDSASGNHPTEQRANATTGVEAKDGAHNSDRAAAEERIRGFGSALSNFLFSYNSLTSAFTKFSNAWNGFTIFRRVFWSPTLWAVQTIYPNFINASLGDGTEKGLNVPSAANGGLMSPLEAGKRVFNVLTFDSDLQLLKAWEAKILPVERLINEHAIRSGYTALAEFVKSQEGDLKPILKMGGVNSLTDPKIAELSKAQRTFFRYYVDQLSSRSLNQFLSGLIERESAEIEFAHNPNDFNTLKKQTLSKVDLIEIDLEQAKKLVADVAQQNNIYELAAKVSNGFEAGINPGLKAMESNLRYQALKTIDPQYNPTMKRIQVVLSMLQKEDSMPRAVRATLSSLLTAKTIGLTMSLFALAGIKEGINVPFHPDAMFGPESYFYMGRYAFVNGLLMGLATGIFSNAWMKLQSDAKHSEHFGAVPNEDEAKMSPMRWYLKQTFKNPENTWWGNQKINLEIIWGNMKPSFVLFLVTSIASLGRFDLDGYFIGYLVVFLNPLMGFNSKLEQGVEFASFYALKDFSPRDRQHPLVQQYLARKQQTMRFFFSIWEKTFVDVQEAIIGNFQRIADVAYGGREALSRLVLGGRTPTEIAIAALLKTNETLGWLPGITAATAACEKVLTNNYKGSEPLEAQSLPEK